MATTQLTAGEIKMLKAIAQSDFRDSDDLGSPVWSPCENNQDKGYLGSLVKKELVMTDCTAKSGDENVWLTDLGIEAYKNIKQLY